MKKSNAMSEEEIKLLLIRWMNDYQEWEEEQGIIPSENVFLARRYAYHLQIAGAIMFGMLSAGIVMIAIWTITIIFL